MADQDNPRGAAPIGDQSFKATSFRSGASTHKHMGTATSDPNYLPLTDFQKQQVRDAEAMASARGASPADIEAASSTIESRRRGIGDSVNKVNGTVSYGRYLQTPKPGRSLFSSRRNRQRQRIKVALGVLIFLAVVLALVWIFVLR